MMRLLLIDDERRKAEALINYFREVNDWIAEMANGPDEALEMLRLDGDCPYDVIILDVMMDPGCAISAELSNRGRDTGLVLLERIVGRLGDKTAIIIYSARTDLEHLKSDRRIAAFIQKPRSAREVAADIESLFSRN
jgi:DNA-binding response OmpR family regulator